MNELNPTVDLGTLIFDQIGEVRFTSAFLNSSNEIVVENSRLAAFIEENFVHWPVKSMTLCEDNYEWSLCAELEVPADLDCDDPRWGDDEYHFFRSHNWETNMKLSKLLYPNDKILRQLERNGPGWTLILPGITGEPCSMYGVGYRPYIKDNGEMFHETDLFSSDYVRLSLDMSRNQLNTVAHLAGCENDWPVEVLLMKEPKSGRGYLRIEFVTAEHLLGESLSPKFVTLDILDIALSKPVHDRHRCPYALRWCNGSQCRNTAKELCGGYQTVTAFMNRYEE